MRLRAFFSFDNIKSGEQFSAFPKTMPVKRPKLVNGEIYHIVVRGIGDSLIFKDINDYYRAIFSLYEFNTTAHIEIKKQREKRETIKKRGELFSAEL